MNDTFFKVWRSSQDDGLWRSLPGEQFKAMIGFLRSVNWTPGEWICPRCGRKLHVPAGGTAKGYRTLADEAAVSPSVMNKTLTRLGRSRFIDRTQTTRCHVIYVVKNWHIFQGKEAGGKRGGSGKEAGSKPILEGKKDRIIEPTTPRPPKGGDIPPEAFEVGGLLRAAVIKHKPDHKLASQSESQARAWEKRQAPVLSKLHRIDKVSWERQRAVLEWLPDAPVSSDGFCWADVVQSGVKLRKQFDKLEAKMRSPSRSKPVQQDWSHLDRDNDDDWAVPDGLDK